jgi:UDP-2-acetamido-2,6-beta-L-arabino-hexul-4-ose reductase
MKTILVTGAAGFIGSHVCLALRRSGTAEVIEFTSANQIAELPEMLSKADAVIHLAGVNRPQNETEFETGNAGLTRALCECLAESGRRVPVVVSSSIQVERDNPYGRSKLAAEKAMAEYAESTGAPVLIFRLPNVFGKWTRPNYNTVVATFCHQVSRKLPVTISDPEAPLQLVYIDDVVAALIAAVDSQAAGGSSYPKVAPVHQIKLGELHERIASFQADREKSKLPDLGDPLTKVLYSTYLSFLAPDDFARAVDLKTDDRGWLFELVKSDTAGQIFVSKTRPGITRGNHYHDTKVEKFCVIQGKGVIRLRHVLAEEIIEYPVDDLNIQVVDIPPGLTHSIENTGDTEMITLFWANEIFTPSRPDTFFVPV